MEWIQEGAVFFQSMKDGFEIELVETKCLSYFIKHTHNH